ncbi:aminotransferase class III-fold pyridoxal phosphate-dependent enzyme [bacterium]|nr:aminotransferase class III-fold pyridoxal phosphate-dependent enzyme [bacterium]
MQPLEQTIDWYKKHISEGFLNLVSFLGFDAVEIEAQGCEVKTSDGRVLLDFLGSFGALNFGHRHPRIVGAVQEGLGRMGASSKVLLNGDQAALAARLAACAPPGLSYSFFSNSGTEAVEAGIKFARAKKGRPGILFTENAYHGKSMGALSAAGREKFRAPFEPLLSGFRPLPFGDANALEDALGGGDLPAAFLVEPIQGEAGIRVPPEGYLRDVRRMTKEAGVLLIVDEVQTGLGRTGRCFAVDWEDVSPDILCIAKSLGGGLIPMGATMTTEDVWSIFDENPLLHSSTLGGNHLACVAALAALEVLEEESLAEKAWARGCQLLEGLRRLDSPLVKEIRGKGLMVGVEFAEEDIAGLVITALAGKGIMAAYTLNNPEVIRLEPPLTVSEEQVHRFLKVWEEALNGTSEILTGLGM